MSLEKEITLGSERVKIKALHTLEEMKLVVAMQEEIWKYGLPGNAFPYPDRCLFEFAESGGLVGGAFNQDGMIGFSAAWLGFDKRLGKRYLHSQLVGIREERRNSGVGYHLKLHQRDYAREMDLDLIKWTFDPTKTRNANLNIRKLGGIVRTYTPDYYGNLQSTFNKGLATDRFWVEWYIDSARVTGRVDKKLSAVDAVGYPVVNNLAAGAGKWKTLASYRLDVVEPEILVEVPADFELVLNESLDAAKEWQRGLREIFTSYFGMGYVVDDLVVVGDGGGRVFYKLNRVGLAKILEPSGE
jgi:predicted GNAT superfamily acetyltransferase